MAILSHTSSIVSFVKKKFICVFFVFKFDILKVSILRKKFAF